MVWLLFEKLLYLFAIFNIILFINATLIPEPTNFNGKITPGTQVCQIIILNFDQPQ